MVEIRLTIANIVLYERFKRTSENEEINKELENAVKS